MSCGNFAVSNRPGGATDDGSGSWTTAGNAHQLVSVCWSVHSLEAGEFWIIGKIDSIPVISNRAGCGVEPVSCCSGLSTRGNLSSCGSTRAGTASRLDAGLVVAPMSPWSWEARIEATEGLRKGSTAREDEVAELLIILCCSGSV
jgi:hypothetical protein